MLLADSPRRELAQTVNKNKKNQRKTNCREDTAHEKCGFRRKTGGIHGIAIWLVCKEVKIRRDRIDAKNHDRDRVRRENHRPESSHNHLTTKLNRGARRRRPSTAAPS